MDPKTVHHAWTDSSLLLQFGIMGLLDHIQGTIYITSLLLHLMTAALPQHVRWSLDSKLLPWSGFVPATLVASYAPPDLKIHLCLCLDRLISIGWPNQLRGRTNVCVCQRDCHTDGTVYLYTSTLKTWPPSGILLYIF